MPAIRYILRCDITVSVVHADIVFFIYLYQRWIYRVDLKRVNEFGTSGEDHTKPPTPTGGKIVPPKDEGAGDSELNPSDTVAPSNGNDVTKSIEEKKND